MSRKRRLRMAVDDAHADCIHHLVNCKECHDANFVSEMCASGQSIQAASKSAVDQMEDAAVGNLRAGQRNPDE